jgi:hypothetical protein
MGDAPVSDGSTLLTSEEASATDAAAVAERFGVTSAQAAALLREQDAFGSFTGTLRATDADAFAGAWIEPPPNYSLNVSFVGSVPQAAKALASAAGLNVIWHDGALSSEKSLATYSRKVSDLIHAALPASPYSVTYEGETGKVTVTLNAVDAASPLLKWLFAASDVVVKIGAFGAPVIQDQLDTRGGAKLLTSASVFICTSGFSVSAGASPTGLVTAGHCQDSPPAAKYQDPGGATTGLTFQSRQIGANGDVGWYKTASAEVPEFWSSSSQRRQVGAVRAGGDINNGDVYCFYGRAGGARCDTVWNRDWSGFGLSRLVVMSQGGTQGGDSGGPWYTGTTAVGIHLGLVDFGGGVYRSTFSKAARVDEALGVNICLVFSC